MVKDVEAQQTLVSDSEDNSNESQNFVQSDQKIICSGYQ